MRSSPIASHRRRQVHANHFPRGSRKRLRDVPRPGRDVQHALRPLQPRRSHQPANAFLIRNPRIRSKRLRLRGKRFSNNLIVLRHDLLLRGEAKTVIVTESCLGRLSTGVLREKLHLLHCDFVRVGGLSHAGVETLPQCAGPSSAWTAAPFTAAEIDATVTRLMAAAKVTGVGLAILNDGKIVYLKSYGFRDRKKSLPLTPDSVMSAASFSKVAFAYMVMQLVQEGVLDLDKPVYQYLPKPLPEYGDYRDLAGDDRYKKITSRMLLDHTPGFPNWRWFEDDHKLHIHFDPGSRFAYSGEGIALLQLVVETVTKKPLEDLMQGRVFQPLGMTRTSMVSHLRFESNSANGYDEQENSLGPQRRLQAQAAGSMKTTPADFARFMQAVLQGQGLRKETKDLMLSPQIEILSKHEFPHSLHRNNRGKQAHPPQLRSRLGCVLDALRKSLLQRRPRRWLAKLHGLLRRRENRDRHHDE